MELSLLSKYFDGTPISVDAVIEHLLSKYPVADFAREQALVAHGSQMYGELPYYRHLDDVAAVMYLLTYNLNIDLCSSLCAAFMHDAIEDTKLTKDELFSCFNDDVCHMVSFVTKSQGLTRRNALDELVQRIEDSDTSDINDVMAIILKVSDRIANMARSKADTSLTQLYKMYLSESKTLLPVLSAKLKQEFFSKEVRQRLAFAIDALSEFR